jgi:tetratricopeptide (TPR) repeat protein
MGIFVLALSARFFYLYEVSSTPSFETPIVDSEIYNSVSQSLVSGRGMSREFFWQPFFYPFFLSGVYSVSDSSIICAKVIQAILGGITCLLTYYLGKRLFGLTSGIIAGVITAFYGPLIFFEGELLASGWAAFWSVVLMLLFLEVSSRRSAWLFAILGLCGGLSIVTRPTFAPFFLLAVIWLGFRYYRASERWSFILFRFCVIGAGFATVAVPIAIQNLRVTGHFGILPSSGGVNFYIGNNPNRAETLTARPGWDWDDITALPKQNGVEGGMWEEQKFFSQNVMNYVFTEPVGFAKGLVWKGLQYINSREIPRNVSVYVFRKWSRLLGVLVWKAGGFGFPFGLLLPLALLGLFSNRRQLPFPLLLFLIFYSLSVVLVFVTSRYRVPLVPVMSVLASAGLLSIIKIVVEFDWRRIAVISVCGAAFFLLATLPGPFPEEKPNYEAELYANVASILGPEKKGEAFAYLTRALELMPDYPSAHGNLGVVLAQMGKYDEAIVHYQKALTYKEDSYTIHNNIASAYVRLGKRDEAFRHFYRALQIKPDYPETVRNIGKLLFEVGKFSEAGGCFIEAIRIEPSYTKAYKNLAEAYAAMGQFEYALETAEQALEVAISNQQGGLAEQLLTQIEFYKAQNTEEKD